MTVRESDSAPTAPADPSLQPSPSIAVLLGVQPRNLAGVLLVDAVARETQRSQAPSKDFDVHTASPWRRPFIQSIKHWLARRREERRMQRDIVLLLQMDDRMLADIGLTRGKLATAVRSNVVGKAKRSARR